MSVEDFNEEFHISDRKLKAVICIYHNLGFATRSPINQMLESIDIELKKELLRYEEVQAAYVYETPLLDVRPFEPIREDAPVYYKEPCEPNETHNLMHVLFMGLALLEQQHKNDNDTEYRVYLVTDERFRRIYVNQIIQNRETELVLHPRFADLNVKFILVKSDKNAGEDIFEEYIRKRQNGEIRCFQKKEF